MQINITKYADIENKGKYNMATIHYSVDGEEKEKPIVSFKNKNVYDTLIAAGPGTLVDIKAEKDGKFWQWTEATIGACSTAKPAASGASGTTRQGGWETPEERAKKQVYIVRQSSISNALEYAKLTNEPDLEKILTTAKAFEMHVFGMEDPAEKTIV